MATIDTVLKWAEQAGRNGGDFSLWWLHSIAKRKDRQGFLRPEVWQQAKAAHARGQREREADQAAAAPVGPRQSPPPSPAEIRARAAEIRQKWTEEEERKRASGRVAWEVPVLPDPGGGGRGEREDE